MRRRDLNLDENGISSNRYRELLYFCRQYADKRKELASVRDLDALSNDGLPHGNGVSKPTERKADIAIKLQEEISLIEDTAREVDPVNWVALIRNVTENDARYEYLQVYSGRRQFYEKRRQFFWLLDKRKKG